MQTSGLAEEIEGKGPKGTGSPSRCLGVLQGYMGIFLPSKPQFDKMEMGLSQWERGGVGFSYPPQSAWQP